LLLQIDYTDTTGERQSVQKTVQLSSSSTGTSATGTAATGFRSRAQDSSLGTVAWALLVLFLGGAVAFNRFKAKNSNWKRLGMFLAAISAMFLAAIFLLGSNAIAIAIAALASLALLAWFFEPGRVRAVLARVRHMGKKAKA
jgi:hypothetical protein